MVKKRSTLTRDILAAVAATGSLMVVVLTAPSLPRTLGQLLNKYQRNSLAPSRIKQRLRDLQRQHLVDISEQGNRTKIRLTKAGRVRVLEYEADDMVIPKQTPWDGQWRYVIFDIPEKNKLARNVFREKLRMLGFVKIKKSVWRHKYPCSPEIEFLTHLYQITRYVSVLQGHSLRQ